MFLIPKWYTYNYSFGSQIPASKPTAPTSLFPIEWITGIDLVVPIKQEKVTRGNCEGYECITCKDFYPMAELNMPEESKDPTSFKCYGCRKGLITIFGKIEK